MSPIIMDIISEVMIMIIPNNSSPGRSSLQGPGILDGLCPGFGASSPRQRVVLARASPGRGATLECSPRRGGGYVGRNGHCWSAGHC